MGTFLQIAVYAGGIGAILLMLFVRAEIIRFRSWTE
jgi:hypothetical protein